MECYSPIERNEVLSHALTSMDLGNIMLDERRRPQKTVYYDIIYAKCPEETNPETQSRLMVARAGVR